MIETIQYYTVHIISHHTNQQKMKSKVKSPHHTIINNNFMKHSLIRDKCATCSYLNIKKEKQVVSDNS